MIDSKTANSEFLLLVNRACQNAIVLMEDIFSKAGFQSRNSKLVVSIDRWIESQHVMNTRFQSKTCSKQLSLGLEDEFLINFLYRATVCYKAGEQSN